MISYAYQMNLRDLKYIVAVAEHLHFGKAAAACFVSQPALSMQVQKLEESLGVQLFERHAKKIRITSVGQELVECARRVLREARAMEEIAQAHQDPFAGEFRLGAFPTLAPYYLPGVVPRIHQAFPKLSLLLVEEKTERLLAMLESGALDAALIALPVEQNDLVTEPLFEDPFWVALPKNHPLARQKSIALSDLHQMPLLLLEEGHCLRSQALAVCDVMGGVEYQTFRASSLETLRQMVVAGVGITLIPQMAMRADKHIVYRPFRGAAPKRTIALVWRKHSARRLCAARIQALMLKNVRA